MSKLEGNACASCGCLARVIKENFLGVCDEQVNEDKYKITVHIK